MRLLASLFVLVCLWAVNVASTRLSHFDAVVESDLVAEFSEADAPAPSPAPTQAPVPQTLSYWLNYFSSLPNTIVGQLRPALHDESDQQLCIGVTEDEDRSYLTQQACRDARVTYWAYNTVNRTLNSLQFPQKNLAVNLRRVGSELRDSYLMTPASCEYIASEGLPFKFTLSAKLGEPEPIVITPGSASDDSRYCLYAPADNSYDARALPLTDADDIERCTLINFVVLKDLFLEGQIMYSDTECLKYDLSAVPPQSVLKLGGVCNPADQSQIFMFNKVNGHVRAKTESVFTQFKNNPVLFMWWSGAIKAYTDVDWAEQPGSYGWDMRTRYLGAVVSIDPRGYSGSCWMISGQQVVVNQTCNFFRFSAFKAKVSYWTPARNLAVMVQWNSGRAGENARCLTMRFDFANVTYMANGRQVTVGQITDVLRWWPCTSTTTTVTQRFLIGMDEYCQPQQPCVAALRWVGDLSKGYLGANRTLVPLSYRPPGKTTPPARYIFKMSDWSTIYLKDESGAAPSLCVAQADGGVVLIPIAPNKCTLFKISTLNEFSPVSMDGAVLVERYLGAASRSLALNLGGGISMVTKSKLVADLGIYGSRRFGQNGPYRFSGKALVVNEFSPGSITFPFVPQRDLANSSQGLISVEFRLNGDVIVPTILSNYYLFGFEKTTGCTVFMTSLGNLGLTCKAPRRYTCVYRFAQYSLADGKRHVVSLLYSTALNGTHRLYVDYEEVGQCENLGKWDINKANGRLNVFYQAGEWRYRPLEVRVYDVMLWTGSYEKLQALAIDRSFRPSPADEKDEIDLLPPDDPETTATRVPPIKTKWENCVPTSTAQDNGVVINDALKCDLAIYLNDKPYPVYLDIFGLGCSRPNCWIYFAPNQKQPSDRYKFTYRPRFPMEFTSENVGTPSPFSDISMLTDGFSYGPVSFGMKYGPQSRSALEVESGANVGAADFVRYQCVESKLDCTCRQIATQDSEIF